jgi:hypothetical protein
MPWYISWALTPWNGWLGVFIAFPHNYSRWTEATAFCRQAHQTVWCTPDMHCSLSGALATSADRWSLQQPTVGSNHCQTVRCTLDSPVLQPEDVCLWAPLRRLPGVPPDSSVHNEQVLFTVRYTTNALTDCPLHGFLRCFFWASFSLSLGLLRIFYVFFWGVASSVS